MQKYWKIIKKQPLRQALILISFIVLGSALVYRFYTLNWLGVIISLSLSLTAYCLSFSFLNGGDESQDDPKSGQSAPWWSLAIYFAIWIGLWMILLQSRTDRPLISPWEVIGPGFFWGYAAASLLLICLLNRYSRSANLLISVHLLLSLSVAAIVYKLGYGFDPFIHEATLHYIDQHGAILPKTNYYLGEYGLFTVLHRVLRLPLSFLNVWSVPLLAAIFLPLAVKRFLKRLYPDSQRSGLNLLSLFFWPLTPFIFTTPQSLAYLFLILSLFEMLPLPERFDKRWRLSALLALAATAIHPLAGLPILAFLALSAAKIWKPEKNRWRLAMQALIVSGGAAIVPLALAVGSQATFSWASWISVWNNLLPTVAWPSQENPLLNALYLFISNQELLFILLIVLGTISACRQKLIRSLQPAYLAILTAILAWLGSAGLNFSSLINYEQSSYASRLLTIAAFFSLPLFIVAIDKLSGYFGREPLRLRSLWAIVIILMLSASLYANYPRRDNYFNSHGISTSNSDLQTVNTIEKQARESYIVLANQQVGAAALKIFGFERYYRLADGQELFFYPIPTSSPLYQYYLDMVYKTPAKKTMAEAMDLVGVKEGYLVVNKYWWAFDKIVAAGKVEADSWQALDNGAVYIFRYGR